MPKIVPQHFELQSLLQPAVVPARWKHLFPTMHTHGRDVHGHPSLPPVCVGNADTAHIVTMFETRYTSTLRQSKYGSCPFPAAFPVSLSHILCLTCFSSLLASSLFSSLPFPSLLLYFGHSVSRVLPWMTYCSPSRQNGLVQEATLPKGPTMDLEIRPTHHCHCFCLGGRRMCGFHDATIEELYVLGREWI